MKLISSMYKTTAPDFMQLCTLYKAIVWNDKLEPMQSKQAETARGYQLLTFLCKLVMWKSMFYLQQFKSLRWSIICTFGL